MTAADPDLSKFSKTFRLELSLTEGPPLAKPVYSHQGLDNVDDLCKQLFPGFLNKVGNSWSCAGIFSKGTETWDRR
ncbi:schlafen family member 11-like [Gymnogyps californianus]|uniref:schlafen family member 11-like n=1 Tax=Gymnogyps californianus TaxID=33616 RepID=UPI0021C7BD9A|nr:schlafen family member 11-like [Gymnogyps californianus]